MPTTFGLDIAKRVFQLHTVDLDVKRQEVVALGRESGDGRDTADALMGPMPVVVVDPVIEGGGSLGRVLVGRAVGPLAQRRLDEAFGLWTVPRTVDKAQPHAAARSNASGLMPPR